MIKFFKKKNKPKAKDKVKDKADAKAQDQAKNQAKIQDHQTQNSNTTITQEQTGLSHSDEQKQKGPTEQVTAAETVIKTEERAVTGQSITQETQENPALESPLESHFENDTILENQLKKSNSNFGKKMKQLFSLKKKIDEELFEDIETTLLMADVGATATMEIMDNINKSVKRKNLSDADAVFSALKENLTELAKKVEKPLSIDESKSPFVILIVGVNGVGKTTTIAKLARKYKGMGKKVMLAAGDTFRAAAVEQLKTWGEREGIPVMAQNTGADSASVIFDAMASAKAKGVDVLIADTAGRLHTQANLMQELEKISRVMHKSDETAPHETLIVVDGGTGQNAISQVREFNKINLLSGIVITKLDGTAKGGVLFNLASEFGIPVRFIGVGEKSSDLKPYSASEFVSALIN